MFKTGNSSDNHWSH